MNSSTDSPSPEGGLHTSESFSQAMSQALQGVQSVAVQWREHEAALRQSLEQVRQEAASLRHQVAALNDEAHALRHEAQSLRERNQTLESENLQLSESCSSLDARCADYDERLREREALVAARDEHLHLQKETNQRLRADIMRLHADLGAQDLPSLILKVCVSLTRSECGLFVEADGDGTLAEHNFKELPPPIHDALYGWTRKVASQNEPTVENDSEKLPDGSQLVNLAALPVSLHGELRGVILVANKRGEDGQPRGYDEDDTEILLAIGRHAGLALENNRLHCELGEAFHSTIAVLADAIEAKDAYTRGHCEDVARLAVRVARRLGFEGEALEQIRYAALLHDIGKIGVPDGILLKPGKLLPEEFTIIQKHATIGRDLVARVPSLTLIAPIVEHHHERYDGSGYPEGLSGEGITLASRVICAVDAFDAMTTPRPYRQPVSHSEGLAELRRCSGSHFDPAVVDAIAEALAEESAAQMQSQFEAAAAIHAQDANAASASLLPPAA
jgi:putative nucleotidyltransferase with HDIG domain